MLCTSNAIQLPIIYQQDISTQVERERGRANERLNSAQSLAIYLANTGPIAGDNYVVVALVDLAIGLAACQRGRVEVLAGSEWSSR